MENYQNYWLTRNLKGFCPPHINPELEIVYVKSGALPVIYDTQTLCLTSGQMAFLFPYHMHSFSPSEDTEAVVYMFPQAICQDFLEQRNNDRQTCRICTIEPVVGHYLDYLLAENRATQDRFRLKCVFYVFAEVYVTGNQIPGPSKPQDMIISNTVKYIFEHLDEELSVECIAKQMGWEQRKLSQTFRSRCGVKITELINNIRIERAVTLLEASELSISEISAICGFGSLRNFNRIFHSRIFCTPSAYRQQHQK